MGSWKSGTLPEPYNLGGLKWVNQSLYLLCSFSALLHQSFTNKVSPYISLDLFLIWHSSQVIFIFNNRSHKYNTLLIPMMKGRICYKILSREYLRPKEGGSLRGGEGTRQVSNRNWIYSCDFQKYCGALINIPTPDLTTSESSGWGPGIRILKVLPKWFTFTISWRKL